MSKRRTPTTEPDMTGNELVKSVRQRMISKHRFRPVRRDIMWGTLSVCAILVLSIMLIAIEVDRTLKARGITHYDRVQLQRLIDSSN